MMRKLAPAALVLGVLAILGWQLLSSPAPEGQPSSLGGLASLKAASRAAMPYEVALGNGRPTLIEFYADWCTTCQGMAPSIERLQQQEPELNFVAIDIDDPRWADPIARYDVRGVPKFVFLDRQATPVETLTGSVPLAILQRAAATAIVPE